MKVVVRADSGVAMGVGHVMRCLTLLEYLQSKCISLDAIFVCRDHRGNLIEFINKKGYRVVTLPVDDQVLDNQALEQHARWLGGTLSEDSHATRRTILQQWPEGADWLIVDHYGTDAEWHRIVRSNTKQLMVIDDLADRQYDCDLLLDQTFGETEARYKGLVPEVARVLAGAGFALLRDEFDLHKHDFEPATSRRWPPRDLLVSLGGGDPDNVTGEVLDALVSWRSELGKITVIVGQANPHLNSLRAKASLLQAQILVGAENMAQLMREHDLAIGAAGATSWERCAMGLPTAAVITAANQKTIISRLKATGAIVELIRPISDSSMKAELLPWMTDREAYEGAVSAAISICDGRGALRTSEVMLTP
ncbi:UDP-2,4-diacetamido-2,4,6-trideoxy-beta-L-altropyranose hydrolase [Motiliproteus coralliicola]|uniref:UDP-2,4-diacetamido-2,4, 6-trideoxy-beta-L-altropyranose hydrolase n=1 Tax=Motiliproteus coralliicola TaxID=2283196 RepID=A0A369WLI8_9GAMM|nr:UDP-2,4-diacetamido-2,4,6-trideoxy-beta-L-altropyranose hydrolase [Motiliproteus coralliicola]RDE22572.1 UDP-2,4-diacetamido-2,4,6-trideoxy-beta-L-altropyranose hydrolase [Motiliproteus coralliicola]